MSQEWWQFNVGYLIGVLTRLLVMVKWIWDGWCVGVWGLLGWLDQVGIRLTQLQTKKNKKNMEINIRISNKNVEINFDDYILLQD